MVTTIDLINAKQIYNCKTTNHTVEYYTDLRLTKHENKFYFESDNKLKAVIKWTDGSRKSHVKLKIYIWKVLKYSLAENAAFNIRP